MTRSRLRTLAIVILLRGGRQGSVRCGRALEKAPTTRPSTRGSSCFHDENDPDADAGVQKGAAGSEPDDCAWAMPSTICARRPRRGAARARRAYTLRPSFDAKLRLAALLRAASQHEEMRTLAAELLESAPAYRRDEVRAILSSLLGAGALASDQPTSVDMAADDLSDLAGKDLNCRIRLHPT